MSSSTFNRADTLLGVCEAIGQDTGVPPTVLRVAFALGLFWNVAAMLLGYLALAVAIGVARWLTPARVAAVPASAAADNDDVALPLAA